MMTIEVTTFEEERVGMTRYKLIHVIRERDVNGVVTVWWTVQHTYKDEMLGLDLWKMYKDLWKP